MKHRTMMLVVGITLLVGMAVCMVTAMLVNYLVGVNDSGSTEVASEWKAILQSNDDPSMKHPGFEVINFPNGEWIIGFSQNSHGPFARGGGTIVVKDSRGNVRAFFGHVCGPHYLQTFFRETPDLDHFYARLKHWHFSEHVLP
jgi:hypothetical protein